MAAVVGYLVARDLGDGAVEPWEARPDGTVPVYATADEGRALMDRYGVSTEAGWTVYALTETEEVA